MAAREIFIEQMRRAMQDNGIAITIAEEDAGLSSGYISKVLSGKINPTLDTCDKIASAFGKKFYPILGEKDDQDA